MKKVLLFLMMLVAMLPAYLQAQDIVEIGTGTSTTYYVPFNALYGYSFTEQLYYAAEIDMAGSITAISFYHKPSSTTTDQTNNIVIYMKNVSRSSFSSSSDFETVTTGDIVYNGTWTIPGTEGWTTITLDNPFDYDGTSNLMIAMHEYTSGYSTRYFTYTSTTESRCVQLYSDSYNPDPYNTGTYSGSRTTRTYLSNIRLEITSGTITCPTPNAPVLSEVTNESATLSWTPRGEESNWDIYITSTQTDVPDSNTVPTDMVSDTFYLAEELNSQTTYYFYVRANCDDGDVSRWKGTTFTTTQIMAILPYEQDFEDETENASWALVNGTQTNKWAIGSAVNHTDDGENALYISNDDGVTNAYSHTASYVWAYRDIDFTQGAGAYQIDFDWRSVGESASYDYLKVYLGDPAVVTAGNGSIPASAHAVLLGNYHNQDTWQHANINLSSEYAGSKRLYFYWYNDGSGGSNPPAAVDNLSILALDCGFPTHLTIDTITSSSVTIHWHPATEDDDMWNVAVAPYGTSADSAEYITYSDTLQEIGDLDPDTRYVIYVRTNCGSEVSSYVTTSFYTDCELVDAMPFAESFDTYGTATSSTTANPGPLPNCWTRLTDNTTLYPYISSSQHASGVGSVYFYATSSYYSMLVSKALDLSSYEANTLNLSFKLLKTSAGYGRMQVGVMTNPNDMSTFVVLKNIYSTDIESTNTWTDFYVTLPSVYADPVYLAFKVPSEATSGVYLDDLLLDETPVCSGPRHLSVSQVQGTSALLNWDEAVFGTPDYLVQYSEQGMDNWSAPVTVTGTTYMLSGLEPSTQYEVRVYADCDGQEADTITGTFVTKCLSGGEVVFDAGSTTTYYVPVGNFYNYSYTQQLFLASELNGATDMRSVSFYYSYGTPMSSKDNVNIYLGHTTQSDFSSTSAWVPVSDLHLVYSGTLNCTQGWNTFAFDSIFHYNGTDNLVLAVDDNSGDYDGSSYVFHSTTTPDYRAMYYQSDSSNPDPANPSAGTRTYNRSNIKFGADCDSVDVCAAPNVYVTSVSTSEVTINWAPGNTESSWAVEYKTSTDQNWTSEGSVINNTYTFTNLEPGTNYQFRVCALCSSVDSSSWTMTSVFVPCNDIATLPYIQDFESATGSGASHTVDPCLTRLTNSSTAYPYPSSTYKNGGTYSMYFYGSSSNYACLALPRMDENIEMNNLMIQFYAYKTSAAYSIEVGVMSDPESISTFEVLGTFTPSAVSTWDMGEVLTNTYTGTGRYIAFRVPQSATSYMYLDDITVDVIPTCPHVTNIHTTSIDEVSAVIKWTAGGNETEWAYLYGPAGTVDVTTETPSYVTEDSVELSNLTPNTLYTIYVQAYCDASDQSTWMHYNFRTECPDFFTVPFAENFDEYGTATSSTTTTPGPLPSCWSRLTNYTSPYPYISSSQHASGVGAVYYYATTTYYNMLVSPQLDLSSYAANTLNLSFKLYKTSASYGRFQVGIMTSPTDATTFVALKEINPTDLPTTNTWTDFNVILPAQYTTPVYLAFKAPAEGTNYVYLDDVLLEEAPDCSAPRHLTISQIQGTSALVTWEDALFGDPEYVLQYSEQGMDAWSSPVTVTGNTYLISGLEPTTHYEVRVYSDCDGQMSAPATEPFVTLCLAGGAVVFDQGTTTNYYVPINNFYHYCYTQEIFLASEMNGATDINSISFDYAYASPMTKKTNVNVYLGHTTQNDFASTSAWVPRSDLHLVYSGALNCTVQGWNTFALDSIFHYNGTDNLVLVVDDNSDQYDGSAYTFRYQSQTPNYRSMYYQSDSSNPDPTNPPTGTRTYNRCNVKFGGECDSVVTCVAPNFYVDNVTTNTADIIWVNGYNETAWEMDYKKAVDSVWTPVPNPTGYLVQLTNLQPSTRYNVRMRSDCGGEYSNPVTANFTTECGAISTLPFVDNFDTYGTGTDVYPMCWSKINTYTSGERPYINTGGFSAPGLLYFFAGSNSYNMAITPEFDDAIAINTLQVSFKYKAYYASDRLVVGVMTDPDSAATFTPIDTIVPDPTNYSTWSDQVVYLNGYQGDGHYIAFKNAYTTTSCYAYVDNLEIDVMPSCLKPTNLNVTCDNTSATLSWTENGTATAWDIEYGAQGFTPGTGSTVAVTTNPYTITGLASGTVYDFRVRANCGGGDESDWSNMVSATPGSYVMPVSGTNTITMCGGVIYDDGGVSGNYSNNCNSTLVVNPDMAGLFVHLTGTYSIETGTTSRWDYLQIFDGSTTDGTLLFDSHTDNSGNLDVVSTTGPLTVYFHTDASTTYSGFEIQIGCDSAQTPPEPCNAPTNLTVSLSGTNATLDWNQEGTPDNWTISYKQASAGAWSTVTTSTKPYTISDLATDVAYEAFVVANCGEEESNQSNHVTFTIVGVNDYVYNTAVYPNPTTGKFRIENSELRIESVEVYDVYGKLITSVKVDDSSAELDLTGNASGTYFTRIFTDKGVVTKRIVKK